MHRKIEKAALGVALASLGLGAPPAHALARIDRGVRTLTVMVQQGEEDVAYKKAREAVVRGQYQRAADLFARLRGRYPSSQYTADSYYWQAFAQYRMEGLRTALELLETQLATYPTARISQESRDLELRLRSMLGRRGDGRAAQRALREAESVLVANQRTLATAGARATRSLERALARTQSAAIAQTEAPEGCEEDDVRQAAIQALMQIETERAIPILRGVLERRDECSVPLRKQAIFVLSQQDPEAVEDLIVQAARTDPDPEVQQAAVFWLSSVGSESAVEALADILASTDDPALEENAMFALSQHPSDRAGALLREYALDASKPDQVREKAIFWLSQHPDHADAAFLIDLYSKLDSPSLKEHVFISVSQMDDDAAADWMFERALDPDETMEVRKQALFWAGQHSTIDLSRLDGLYAQLSDREMKEQLIFLYAQRDEDERIDRLIEIARSEEDPELRKTAIFWLGQTGDDRAVEFLLHLVDHPR